MHFLLSFLIYAKLTSEPKLTDTTRSLENVEMCNGCVGVGEK